MCIHVKIPRSLVVSNNNLKFGWKFRQNETRIIISFEMRSKSARAIPHRVFYRNTFTPNFTFTAGRNEISMDNGSNVTQWPMSLMAISCHPSARCIDRATSGRPNVARIGGRNRRSINIMSINQRHHGTWERSFVSRGYEKNVLLKRGRSRLEHHR